ncbi:hypothetical protein [Parafrigoribacterium mesophilum]|uniref:hypothetical protein n=1 Tax=Parafrigoribacterium mesophilum TaxID=433646 RepID=UPI0031FD5259
MKPPNYEETRLQPLATDALVQERVADLIGRAIQHQLWFLFVDDQQVQLPLVIPMGELPNRPDAFLGTVAANLREAMGVEGASAVIVVLERYADAGLTSADREWALAIHTELEQAGVTMRAILLSHRHGVRWIAQDDYRF